MHVRTDRLRTRDPTESETRAGWRCKLRLKLHRSTPRGFGRKEHFMPTTTYVSSTRLDSEHSGAPTPIFSSRPTKCNFQHPDPRVLGSERSGARPRSFEHSDCDASSPPTRICSARGARGPDNYLLFSYKTMGSHSRADAHDAGPTSLSTPSLRPI